MVDERTLVADVKSYIDELGNFSAEVEEHPEKDNTRTDLIVRYNGKILFNGEFKRPYTIEGKNPRSADLVDDAFLKSQKLSETPRFFITSNFNETVIWDNKENNRPLMTRDIDTISLQPEIKADKDFAKDEIKNAIKETFQKITQKILEYDEGIRATKYKSIDESFILGLNLHLNAAVDTGFKYVEESLLKKWWKEQGYEPVNNFGEDEKKRITRFSLYVLANKIFFYYVLKRAFNDLDEIDVKKAKNISEIKEIIFQSFDRAKKVSGDYETVFEKTDADDIPFSDEEMLYHITNLIKFLELYNFSTLSQDILGNIYDRLISPGERHDNGQYFTPIPVVDLINAITIKKADASVLDPACGSGTFLTRAFDLKLDLIGKDNKKVKEDIVSQLFGVDIAGYPAHLATIALASKLSIQNPKIYPNIIRSDFLDIIPDSENPMFMMQDRVQGHQAKTLEGKKISVTIKPLDAVVSNLPYIRQEEISNKEAEQKKVENILVSYGFPKESPNNTSDFHIYFWYYILPFLKEGARVGFLTSDTWLNVDYGDDLKKFINKYFKIITIIDSSVERYFPDALVNTVITVLERTNDKESIKNNKIKFVRVNKKIGDLIENIRSAHEIARQIESGISNDDVQVVREVNQGDLDFNDKLKAKLYPYLRAPDEFFELVNSKNMVPLSSVMDVFFGIKTGANEFFYVEDLSNSYPADKLKRNWGITKEDLKSVRVIKDGTGQEHLIEKEYLFPVLKSPREFTKEGTLIFKGKTKKCVVIINEGIKDKIKKYARKYLEYGEKEGYNKRPSCESRPFWWKLSPIIYPDVILAMYFSSTFIYPEGNYLLDAQLYFGKLKDAYKNDILAVFSFLNSSLSYLYPDIYGRNYGGGAVGFKVYEVKELPVIKPEILRPYYEPIKKLIDSMAKRRIGSVFEEIWDGKGTFTLDKVKPDRYQFDKLILTAMKFDNPDKFLTKWYQSVVRIVKERLDKAASTKKTSKPGKVDLDKIAENIIESIEIKKFPDNYLKGVRIEKTVEISQGNEISYGSNIDDISNNGPRFFVSVDKDKYYFDSMYTAEYVSYCAKNGLTKIDLPSKSDIKKILRDYKSDRKALEKEIRIKIDEFTEDKKYIDKIYKICSEKLGLIDDNKISK